MYTTIRQFFPAAFLALSFASLVSGQATRTWVSGVGDDANPCSRTAPCKTFAGAISKTAAGGEISVLDPAGFGAVTITKAITLSGDGILASILVSGSNGITVQAGASDVVVIRNLSLNGISGSSAGAGLNGVRFLSGESLLVEKCTIHGFSQNGVEASLSGGGSVSLQDVSIVGGNAGVRIFGTSGRVVATLNRVLIQGATNGVDGAYGLTTISNSTITQNTGVGVLSEGTGIVSVVDSVVSGNNIAVRANTGSTVRMSNNDFYDNLTGFACGGGTLASAANNRKAGNTGGVLPVCAPTLPVNVQ